MITKKFETGRWYIHKPTGEIFFCHAIDGEYLFKSQDINGVGYSSLLCKRVGRRNRTQEYWQGFKRNFINQQK